MVEVVQLETEKASEGGREGADESLHAGPPRSIWSGSLRIGLVNIPVKAVAITRDSRVSLRMLHKSCKTPISLKRFCQEGEEVSMAEIVYGYPLGQNKYAVLEKKEIDHARPQSRSVISLDKFVNFFSVDPHYYDKTYLLLPDRSEEAYSLFRSVMEKTGKAAIGRITMRSRERLVLVHYYQKAIVATTLRYSEEVTDPESFAALRELPQPGEKELDMAMEIVKGLSGDLDLAAYRDEYRERIEALVRSRIEGIAVAPVKLRARPPARSLMEALRKTAESLK